MKIYMVIKMKKEELAENHINWFLELIKPLLITNFIHGYEHGKKDKEEK